MSDRILALGISGLPNTIKCISWEEAEKLKLNISDYDIVFIDFSYLTKKHDRLVSSSVFLYEAKFLEIIESGVHLFILGVPSSTNDWYQVYSWLPDIIRVTTNNESGEVIDCLNKSFSDYFNLLKKWSFYFKIQQSISEKNPYLYDINEIAINKAGKKLGFEITNFKAVDINEYNRLKEKAVIKKSYNGKLYILHTLNDNSANGILSILKKLYNISFSRQKPVWNDEIQTENLSILTNEMKKLFEDKQKIESEISQKFNDIEKIEYFKQLLWQVGTELEDVVHASLKLIGLLPSSPTKADDDGILNYNKEEYMLEIKSGLEHAATFTELSKLITRMESRKKLNKKECKGIFIMNHYANHPPSDRDKPFPKNVIDTAKVNNVKLITTEQLFNIIKQVLDKELLSADAQKQLFSL